MLGDFLVDSVVAALLIAAWYFWFRQSNRRRSEQIVGWIERAFAGRAECIRRVHWDGASRFRVELGLSPQVFRRASLSVRLEPRELPLQWLVSRLRERKETVTFEAELDRRPSFNFYLQHHHWQGSTRRIGLSARKGWQVGSLTPVVITTEPDVQQSRAAVIDVLLAAQSGKFLQVAFRKKSPQFMACAPLASLSPEAEDSGMLSVLQELAHSASASMQ